MLTDIATLGISIEASGVDKASRSLDNLTKEGQKAEQSTNKLSTSFDSLSKYASAAAAAISGMAIVSVAKDAIQAALAMERLEKMFKAAAGSAELAATEFQYVKDLSNKMGLDVKGTAESYAKFMIAIKGTTVEGEKGRRTFEGLSTAMAALGKTPDEANRVFIQIQQGFNKTKIQLEDINIVAEAGIPVWTMMEKAVGKSKAEIADLMGKGKLMAEDVWPKVAEQMEKTFGEAAKTGMHGAQAEINRFNNAMLDAKAAAGSSLLPVFADIVRFITPALTKVREMTAAIQIFGVRLAQNAMKRETLWDNIKSGRGVFSAEGLARQKATSDEADRLAEEQINGILDGTYGVKPSDYTAAQRAAQAGNKPSNELAKKDKKIKSVAIFDVDNAEMFHKGFEAVLKDMDDFYRQQEKISKQESDNLKAFLSGNEAEKAAYDELKKAEKAAYDATPIGGMTNAIEEYGKVAANVGQQIKDTFTNAFKGMEDAIVSFVQTGKLSLSSLFQQIQADLIRMTIAKPITNQLAGLIPTAAIGASLFGSGGTAVASSAAGGMVNASGGAVTSGLFGTGGAMTLGGGLALGGIAIGLAAITSAIFSTDNEDERRSQEALKMQKKIDESILSGKQALTGQINLGQITALEASQQAERVSTWNTLIDSMPGIVHETAGEYLITGRNKEQALAGAGYAGGGYISADDMLAKWEQTYSGVKVTWDNLAALHKLQMKDLIQQQEYKMNGLKLSLLETQGLKGSAEYMKRLNARRDVEIQKLDGVANATGESEQSIQRMIWALEDQKTATEAAAVAISKIVDIALSAANAIKDIQGSSLSNDSPAERYRKAKLAFATATPEKAGEYGKAFLEQSQAMYASGSAYKSDYKLVMDKLSEIAGITGTTTADKQLQALGDIKTAIEKSSTDNGSSLIQLLGTEAPLTKLMGQLSTEMQAQLKSIALSTYKEQLVKFNESYNTAYNAYLSGASNLDQFKNAMSGTVDTLNKTATGAINAGNTGINLATNPADKVTYTNSGTVRPVYGSFGKFLGVEELWFNSLGKYEYIKSGSIPKFAMGGITNGLSIAGEAGPEAIIPLPDGRNVPVTIKQDNNLIVLTQEMIALRKEVIALRKQQAAEHSEDVQMTNKVASAVTGNAAAMVRF